MARWGFMDDRIEAFVNDMHMFTGELKVIAMGQLLTAIIERQSAMMDRMRQMRGLMMGSVVQRPVPDVSLVWPGEEPGMMCASPF